MNDKMKSLLEVAKVDDNTINRVLALPVPRFGDEGWQHMRPSLLLPQGGLLLLSQDTKVPHTLAELPDGHRIVFYNNTYAPELSIVPEGVSIVEKKSEIGEVACTYDAIASLGNTTKIHIAKDTQAPLKIVHIVEGRKCLLILPVSCLVVVEDGVRAEVELYMKSTQETRGVVYSRVECIVGAHATCSLVEECLSSMIVYATKEVTISQGGDMDHRIRCNTSVLERVTVQSQVGEGGAYSLGTAIIGLGASHVEVHVEVQHIGSHSKSMQKMRVVGRDTSIAVVDSKIYVEKETPGCDAHQDLKALLLSNQSKVHLNPMLEIYTDEVTCSHGASVGHMDIDMLSYLALRGIGEVEAKEMLAAGFVKEVSA